MATRRDVIAVTIGAALSRSIAPAEAQTSPKTFVLVHGAWGGGWVSRRVADLLEKRGHKVFAPATLDIFAGELVAMAEGRAFFEAETVLQTLTGARLTVLFTITFPPPSARRASLRSKLR